MDSPWIKPVFDLEDLHQTGWAVGPNQPDAAASILTALTQWIQQVVDKTPLAIAIDSVELIDPTSATLPLLFARTAAGATC